MLFQGERHRSGRWVSGAGRLPRGRPQGSLLDQCRQEAQPGRDRAARRAAGTIADGLGRARQRGVELEPGLGEAAPWERWHSGGGDPADL
jgi:hypothetical protein